jgi:hypothetical protein
VSDYLVKNSSSAVELRNLFCVGIVAASTMLFAKAYPPDAYSAMAGLSLSGSTLGFSTPSIWGAFVDVTPRSITGTTGGIDLRRKHSRYCRFVSYGLYPRCQV